MFSPQTAPLGHAMNHGVYPPAPLSSVSRVQMEDFQRHAAQARTLAARRHQLPVKKKKARGPAHDKPAITYHPTLGPISAPSAPSPTTVNVTFEFMPVLVRASADVNRRFLNPTGLTHTSLILPVRARSNSGPGALHRSTHRLAGAPQHFRRPPHIYVRAPVDALAGPPI